MRQPVHEDYLPSDADRSLDREDTAQKSSEAARTRKVSPVSTNPDEHSIQIGQNGIQIEHILTKPAVLHPRKLNIQAKPGQATR